VPYRKVLLGLSIVVLCATASVGQKKSAAAPPAQADPAAKLQGIDDLAAKAMAEWKVPGLALGIVKDGKLIYSKGYGFRDVEHKVPVDTDTLFAIGSISKSFTSLAFAMLNDDGKIDWDKPVRDYLPEFQLYDPVASERATPRDLFAHRTGLPRHDLVWYSSDFSRADMVSRLRYLKPSKDFRSAYQYNNLTIMTMGYLEGKLTGLGWEGTIRDKIFTPLGMSHSDFSVEDIEKTDNHALPYELKKEVVTQVPFHNIDAIGPAGSINSSVADMSHYLTFQLGDGKYEGKQLVSESNLRLMHSAQTAMPGLPPALSLPELGNVSYGLTWVVTAYRGHNLVWHNGGIDGFYALLSMLPDDHMGIVILTNMAGQPAPEILAYNVYDRLLGLDQLPWLTRFQDRQAKQKKEEEESKKNKVSDKKAGTHPSHDLKDYAGTYENPGYGVIQIGQSGDGFTLKINKLGPYPLVHYHYDIFQIPEDADTPAAGEQFQFLMDKKGDIHSISAALEPALQEDIVFTRAGQKIAADILRTLAGEYVLNGTAVTVALTGDTLRLTLAGQPQYELVPAHDLTFDIKGMAGFSVEFKKDESNKVVQIVLYQPDGAQTATRKQ
jgi:CubicO group peptidase (beta-lactamase class C family)